MAGHPLVLYYHAFGTRSADEDPHNLFVPADAFAAQLERLRSDGWRPLDLDGYLAGWDGRTWPRRSVLLTIDDAFVSTLEIAAPVLREHRTPAVLFAPGGLVGGRSTWMPAMPDEPLLDADGLRALADYDIEIGVHGWDHSALDRRTPDELRRQCVDPRDLLTGLLGHRPRAFAYPSGRYDAAAVEAVRAAGYDIAFATETGWGGGRYLVPRVGVNATDTPRTFRLKLHRAWPRAQRVLDRVPRLRSLAHRLIGSAR
jgi:peptidoglycan/xylan/chitin deacetylase (PgdA/CDA1 family)